MADQQRDGFFRIGNPVKRLNRRPMFPGPQTGNEERVLFLNMRRVQEHDGAQIARGARAMNRSAITLFHEIGQVARVVNVRVAQYHRINLPRVKWKRTIPLRSLFAMTLKQAAFQQQPPAIDFQQIHRARGGARRAEEVDFHRPKA